MPREIKAIPYEAGLILIGTAPFAVNENDVLIQRIHTFFMGHKAYITEPGTHADQRWLFIDYLNQERVRNGQPELTSCERDSIMEDSVSIVMMYDDETNLPYIGVRNDGDLERAKLGFNILSEAFPEQVRII